MPRRLFLFLRTGLLKMLPTFAQDGPGHSGYPLFSFRRCKMNPSSQHGQGSPGSQQPSSSAQPMHATETGRGSQAHESTMAGTAGVVMERAQELASNIADKAGEAWESTTQGARQAASAVASRAE